MSRRPPVTITDIAELLGAREQLAGLDEASTATVIARPASVEQAGEGEVTFIDRASTRGLELLRASAASLVLVPAALRAVASSAGAELAAGAPAASAALTLVCPNPRLAFVRVLDRFYAPERPTGIHPRAVVEEGASVAASAYVGPLATIAEGVSIGERTVIHAGVHVYPGCTIGADCTVHAGAVIGADGFGFERSEHGVPERFPHVGTVVIEDDVEIGANACIDRGALGATVIRAHARIDDLVYVAHNVEVGEGALVVAMTMMAGGAKLGERCYIAPSSILRDGISIGGEAIVGLGAVVVGDVAPGATVAGNPARDIAELKALGAALRELAAGRRSVLPGD